MVPGVPIAKEPVEGQLKVVLYHRAAVLFGDMLPHGLEAGVLGREQLRGRLRGVRWGREGGDVPAGGVDIDEVRGEGLKLLAEHGVLVKEPELRLVELGLYAEVQKEQLQDGYHVMGGGAAKDGYLFLYALFPGCQQLPADRFALFQDGLGVEGVCQKVVHEAYAPLFFLCSIISANGGSFKPPCKLWPHKRQRMAALPRRRAGARSSFAQSCIDIAENCIII